MEGNRCASFMDTFNVEVTVTLMLNMLDEVTNTVQLIKFDYAGKKTRDITTDSAAPATCGCGLGIVYSHVNVSQTLRLRSKNAKKNVEETEGLRILLCPGLLCSIKKSKQIYIYIQYIQIYLSIYNTVISLYS